MVSVANTTKCLQNNTNSIEALPQNVRERNTSQITLRLLLFKCQKQTRKQQITITHENKTQDFVSKLNISKQNPAVHKKWEKHHNEVGITSELKVGLNFNQGKSLTNIQNKEN